MMYTTLLLNILFLSTTLFAMDIQPVVSREKKLKEDKAQFLTAVYNGDYETVKKEKDKNNLLFYSLPVFITKTITVDNILEKKIDAEMRILMDYKPDISHWHPSPLIMACLSRDKLRIRDVILGDSFFDQEMSCGTFGRFNHYNLKENIEYALCITLDFHDLDNFYYMLYSPTIKERAIKNNLPLQYAIYTADATLLKTLIENDIFDINMPCYDYIADWLSYAKNHKHEKKITILDMTEKYGWSLLEKWNNTESQIIFEIIKNILKKNGARNSGLKNSTLKFFGM